MPLPTLLQKGFLRPSKWMTKAEGEKLDAYIPMDYIMNYFKDRMPDTPGAKPRIVPKCGGDRVIVLKSSTGSGKSTALPHALYTNFIENIKKNIAVTQPRVLTCIDIPQGIVQWATNLEMEKNIGYNTGAYKRPPKEKGIIFCTTEIIAQQYLMSETAEDFMKLYSFIVIDEVHTRDSAIDRILFLMKKLLNEHYENPECPLLILTSATFDEDIFMNYFNVPKSNYIEVEGFAYPKTNFYPKYDLNDFKKYAVKKALQIHLENLKDVHGKGSEFRDMMIFIPTTAIGADMVKQFIKYNHTVLDKPYNEIKNWKQNVLDPEIESIYIKPTTGGGDDELEISDDDRFYILPILLTKGTFDAGGSEYQNMFSPIETISMPLWDDEKDALEMEKPPTRFVVPSRRIIIGTNIAETGVTIDSLKYCIDTGYENHVEYNPDYSCSLTMIRGCTQGMVVQRKGRVGRKSPGFWYPCFTEETFNAMQVDQHADVLMADPTENLLNMICNETETKIIEEENAHIYNNEDKRDEYGLFKRNYLSNNAWWRIDQPKTIGLGAMDFIETPSAPALSYSMEKLHMLGFIDDDYKITLFGYLANKFRMIPSVIEAKRMIFEGFVSGAAIMDLITITAFLQLGRRMGIYGKKFKMPNLLGVDNFDFINKIIIGDDFINSILLWNVFCDWLNTKIPELFNKYKGKFDDDAKLLYVDDVKEWCSKMEISYDGWVMMARYRDLLIQDLLDLGINVYYNTNGFTFKEHNLCKLLRDNFEVGLEEVKKIKQAIYRGYYMNLCKWVPEKYSYISIMRNIPILTESEVLPKIEPGDVEQTRPKYIIVSSYEMLQSKTSPVYEFNALSAYISVMDNYVDVDDTLGM